MDSFSLWHWLIVGVIVFYLAHLFQRGKARVQRALGGDTPKNSAGGELHVWPPLGDFDFPVVGESNYQAALKAIAGNHGKNPARAECVAELIPDDRNRFDDKAVEVRVNRQTVGYLSREDARSFRRRLGQKGLAGQTTYCDALVVGGGVVRREKHSYGIQLDIKPFE